MRQLARIGIFALMALSLAEPAVADSGCNGILNSNEIAGFNALFTPPFSPSLTSNNGDWVKSMSQSEFTTMSRSSMLPLARQTLTAQQATNLAGWLNNHASSSIPGWLSTGLGLVNSVMGLIADIAIQGISAANGDAQTSAGNLAGKVSEGGLVGVVPGATTVNGKTKFIWSYIYKAELNGKSYVNVLYACQADVLIK